MHVWLSRHCREDAQVVASDGTSLHVPRMQTWSP
jgi:hypothetical protein